MTFKADFLPTSEERDVPNTCGTGPQSRARFSEGRCYICDERGNSVKKFISLELSPLGSLSHWLVSRASVGTDPPEVRWAIVSDLTGPGNLEQCPLFCFWFLIIGLQGYLRFLSTGELLPSHIHDFFFSLSPLPSFPPTLSLLPSSACWLFFFFFLESSVFYDLSPFLPKFIQCVFWLFHLPLRASWRSECSEAFLFLRHPV